MTRATLTGPWPGTDPVAAARDILNALGEPHLPVLPELPDRGPGSDPIGRTAALLDELAVDLQPHGWRLVAEPGRDHRRAVAGWTTDLNGFTDCAGESGTAVPDLLVRLAGPMTLAAGLWLPGGERSLSDAGARRDVVQSLASGLADRVRAIRSATGTARLTVLFDEPRAAAVLSGALPTASGYRTVRSIPRSEVRQAWTLVAQSALDAGAAGIVLAPGRVGTGDTWSWTDLALLASESLPVREDPVNGLVLPLAPLEGPGADPSRWDIAAGWTEAGRQVMLGLPATGGDDDRQPYRATAVGIARTWSRIGLDPVLLSSLSLRAPDLSASTHRAANRTLAATVAAAEELERIRQDGGL